MRKQLLVGLGILAALIITFATPKAHAFPVFAQAFIGPYQVSGQVLNQMGQPLYCSIRVQGIRNDGFSVWAYSNALVYPGTNAFAYVYTGYPFNFINGQAFADCNFAGFFGPDQATEAEILE